MSLLSPSPPWLTLRRLEQIFWALFIVLPMFTGWLAYNWLPNEAFDKRTHELLRSHEVCRDVGEGEDCGDMADVWKDRRTGEVYTRAQFAWHRESEPLRMLYTDFGYGLIGSVVFAFFRARERVGVFFAAFGKAVFVNAGICLIFYLMS